MPRSTPAEQQVDPAAILRLLDALAERSDIEMHSLMLVRHGHVVAEGWWAPYDATRRTLLYSLSKSFTSTAAAFAQAEGLLDLDDTVIGHFGEYDADITDPRSRSIKVRHVASMAAGHTREMLGEAMQRDPRDPVRGFLLSPPDREPGTVFAYSQPCTYTLASIIQRNAGMPLTRYLRPRLFDPLGIGPVGWQTLPPGREQGFSGLHARTEDVAKLGLLYLQRGRWQGAQLIPESWVAEATSVQVANPDNEGPDWRQGYGFQFWMARHGYRGDGAFGQFCVVLPEQDAVVVTTACTLDMQAMLDAMWTHLLPGLGTDATPEAHDELTTRLARLELPARTAAPAPADWTPWTSAPFPIPGGPFTSVEIAQHSAGYHLTLTEPGNAITFPVGAGTWGICDAIDHTGETIPVAASGGWLDEQTLRAEVIFLETPHRIDLTCELPDHNRTASATATWRIPPFGVRGLSQLHCPA